MHILEANDTSLAQWLEELGARICGKWRRRIEWLEPRQVVTAIITGSCSSEEAIDRLCFGIAYINDFLGKVDGLPSESDLKLVLGAHLRYHWQSPDYQALLDSKPKVDSFPLSGSYFHAMGLWQTEFSKMRAAYFAALLTKLTAWLIYYAYATREE